MHEPVTYFTDVLLARQTLFIIIALGRLGHGFLHRLFAIIGFFLPAEWTASGSNTGF